MCTYGQQIYFSRKNKNAYRLSTLFKMKIINSKLLSLRLKDKHVFQKFIIYFTGKNIQLLQPIYVGHFRIDVMALHDPTG